MVGPSSSIPIASIFSGGIPSSSRVSRRAVCKGVESSGSRAPPGKEICPPWLRRAARRLVNTRYGCASRMNNGARTADSRNPGWGCSSIFPGRFTNSSRSCSKRGSTLLARLDARGSRLPLLRERCENSGGEQTKQQGPQHNPIHHENDRAVRPQVSQKSGNRCDPGEESHRSPNRKRQERGPIRRFQEVPELKQSG